MTTSWCLVTVSSQHIARPGRLPGTFVLTASSTGVGFSCSGPHSLGRACDRHGVIFPAVSFPLSSCRVDFVSGISTRTRRTASSVFQLAAVWDDDRALAEEPWDVLLARGHLAGRAGQQQRAPSLFPAPRMSSSSSRDPFSRVTAGSSPSSIIAEVIRKRRLYCQTLRGLLPSRTTSLVTRFPSRGCYQSERHFGVSDRCVSVVG